MAMAERLEFIPPYDFVLLLFDLLIVKLYEQAALCAYEMIVVGMLVLVLVEHAPVMELQFTRQPALS
jgi:hypothetical protein